MKLTSNVEKAEITMRGPIGDFDGGISADDFSGMLDQHAGQDVTIMLDSEGGSVLDGVAIYNAISQHEGSVTIHIDTLAASIATIIACAADKVVMNSNAKYFVHRAWTVAMGNCKDFRSTAALLEMMDGDLADAYKAKTGMETEIILEMMDAETWMTAEQAVEHGFADEINDVREPKAEIEKPCPMALSTAASFSNRVSAGKFTARLDRMKNKLGK